MTILRKPIAACVLACLAFGSAGCALLTKSDPIAPRYYNPERLNAPDPEPTSRNKPDSNPAHKLRLRAVRASEHLKERIVFRDSPTELGFYDGRRWTELPEHYLRRQLSAALFESQRVQQVIAGPAATLEVEMSAFEEVREPRRVGRVQIMFLLHDGNLVRFRETVTIERPIAGEGTPSAEATVSALGEALAAAVQRIVDRTLRELDFVTPTRPSPVPEPPPLP
ncbi:ABC-type transport auxiliary lipoprotein family protein [Chondromyces crocatus]|uniref:ABC-type transport auxiliary lipoprotein component domain-containing protein n=1 Tax=Chondromyces crocatus TaxID=52 RepID=A0A0K1EHA0_CHOCO|nr:ABC-type transport auxiliary lipoprotein family protein [Chondromyces crocatus]AKT40229.1 uncharacterized protein CMC5_043820 [Chondromyces crocatus]